MGRGIKIGDDVVCYTQDFIVAQGDLINTTVGGRKIVVAYDPIYESIGAYYNDGDGPVSRIDFFGGSDQGNLARVENFKAGLFLHVWVEFFPLTDINRLGTKESQAA